MLSTAINAAPAVTTYHTTVAAFDWYSAAFLAFLALNDNSDKEAVAATFGHSFGLHIQTIVCGYQRFPSSALQQQSSLPVLVTVGVIAAPPPPVARLAALAYEYREGLSAHY